MQNRRMVSLALRLGIDKHRILVRYAVTVLWSIKYLRGKSRYRRDKQEYKKLNTREAFRISEHNRYQYLDDWDKSAGTVGAYFYQDLWAAKKIHISGVKQHFDIGSRVDGFILAILSFVNVTLMDIRPLDICVQGLDFVQTDATSLDNIDDGSIASLSALCSLEHFGLGRYGDPIDPEACFKAFKAIQRVIIKGGTIYISVPVGPKDRLEFNAHRIFSPQTIISEFHEMELREFSVVKADGRIVTNALEDMSWIKGSSWSDFGLFEFVKS